jgi:hypothetical protein
VTTILTQGDWHWSRTQYKDDKWVEPETQRYRLRFGQKAKLEVRTSCKKMKGNYLVIKGFLSITVKQPFFSQKSCDDQTIDNTYLQDLSRVVDYTVMDDRLVLELDNNSGFMYFSKNL